MILPEDDDARHRLYRNLARECGVSQNERRSRAQAQRSAYLTGTDTGNRALYNRLKEWAESSAANLYAPDSARWDVTVDEHYGDKYLDETSALRAYFTRYWKASKAALVYDLGVEWAHPFDSVVFKVVSNGNRPVLWMLPDPADLGVLEENQPDLDLQEAICHYYDLNLSAFERLLFPLPPERKAILRAAAADHAAPPRNTAGFLPQPVSNILLTVAQPANLSGAIVGMPNVMLGLAKVQEPCARMAELWVRDDRAEWVDPVGGVGRRGCWRRVLIHVPTDEILYETPVYDTYGADHAFELLTLGEVPGYLWGLSPMDGLVALQMWREKRMMQADLREDLQLNPPLLFAGVLGLTDEQAERVRTPGGNVYSQYPNASAQPILAPMPPDALALVDAIDRMFDRLSGMTRGGAGEGQPNVRSGEQEFALAALASPRPRRKATRVEYTANRLATKMIRMLQRVDGLTLQMPSPTPENPGAMAEFFPAQIPELTATITAHSASPYYEAAIKADAVLAKREGAIDAEDFVEALTLPLKERLKVKARRRMQNQSEIAKGQLDRENKLVRAKEVTAMAAAERAEKS